MSVKLNHDAYDHAKKLIKDGKYEAGDGDWSKHQPDTDAENSYIDKHNMRDFGNWYLGENTEEDKENKGRYEFPFGDFNKVHRGGLIAIKQRAAQYDHNDIEKAADDLMDMIDKQED